MRCSQQRGHSYRNNDVAKRGTPPPQTTTGALSLDPAGDFRPQTPCFVPRSKFLATPLYRNGCTIVIVMRRRVCKTVDIWCSWQLFICSLTFTTFSVELTIPQSRLQLSFILLLTTITFKFVVSQTLPRISYLTYLVSRLTLLQSFKLYKKVQLSLTNPRDACEKFARFT